MLVDHAKTLGEVKIKESFEGFLREPEILSLTSGTLAVQDILEGEEAMLDMAALQFRKAYENFERVEHLKGMYVAKEYLIKLLQSRDMPFN